jgi:hypothetical protein
MAGEEVAQQAAPNLNLKDLSSSQPRRTGASPQDDGLRGFYRSPLRGMRRQNHRAKLGRYTPSGIRNTAVTPADLASADPSRPHPGVAS